MTLSKTGGLCLACFLLTGCGLFMSPADRAMRNSQPYKNGYSDGCATANAEGASYRGGTVRDEDQFKTSRAYRSGWSSGFSACRLTTQGPARSNPIANPLSGR
jgi:hypothetical protein